MNKILCLVVALFCAVQGKITGQVENVGIPKGTATVVEVFALKSAEKFGDVARLWEVIEKIDALEGHLTKEDAKDFLEKGRMNKNDATMAVENLLPVFDHNNYDEETQITALLTLANLVCTTSYEECDVAEILSTVTEQPYYGCSTEGEDKCYCDNQRGIYLWTRFVANHKEAHDELKGGFPCEGKTVELNDCICIGIEEYEESRAPQIRSASDMLKTIMLQNMASDDASPLMLSIIANSGSGLSSAETIKQIVLAQMGLDPTLTHVLLNGGTFSDDADTNRQIMLQYIASSGAIPQMLLPLLAGADNAREFMLFSMLSAGDLDPVTGLIMLSRMSDDIDSDVVQALLLETMMSGADTSSVLASITDPYVPELPDGIFPGSELSFAHFNALEVSTCALHDLRNRFDCGYIGISAPDCEKAPYCCYSPVFMSDAQVSSSTGGAITAASSIPWCYYNVFFVFPTEFALTVQSIGGFATGLQCPPLFKYGLSLDSTTYALAQGSSGLGSLINSRDDCGFPGITEFHCVAIRGCCFDPDAPVLTPQCYNPRDNVPSILTQTIPAVFQGVIGHCDMNIYQVPLLYLLRKPCHYTLEQYAVGFDVLQEPTAEDCLTRLGCCYEFDDAIAAANPKSPRCYAKATSGAANPLTGTSAGDLITRSGDDAITKQFPPNTQ
jgi:hypothetical protein